MGEIVEHTGVILSNDNGHIKVQIQQSSACSACHAKGACTASDVAEKVIDVYDNGDYQVGQLVHLYGADSLGMKAVMYAFIIPFLIMAVVLFISMNYFTELESGLYALLSLFPYYAVLFFFRKSFSKVFVFYIKPIK